MAALPGRFWQDWTTADFAAADAAALIAVLPVGAVEQHGPHLPLGTDAMIADAVIAALVARLPDDLPVVILPTLPVGKSNEHQDFPGTLTLSAETLIRLWTEVGESVARAGVRKLVLLNTHGGQPEIMAIVAQDLRTRLGMLVVRVNRSDFGLPDGLFPVERSGDIHAGAVETSLMLAIAPGLVREAERRDFRLTEGPGRWLRPTGRPAYAWQAQDLNPAGAMGDATDADAARGGSVIGHAADGLLALLRELHGAVLPRR